MQVQQQSGASWVVAVLPAPEQCVLRRSAQSHYMPTSYMWMRVVHGARTCPCCMRQAPGEHAGCRMFENTACHAYMLLLRML